MHFGIPESVLHRCNRLPIVLTVALVDGRARYSCSVGVQLPPNIDEIISGHRQWQLFRATSMFYTPFHGNELSEEAAEVAYKELRSTLLPPPPPEIAGPPLSASERRRFTPSQQPSLQQRPWSTRPAYLPPLREDQSGRTSPPSTPCLVCFIVHLS